MFKIRKNDKESLKCEKRCKSFSKKHVSAVPIASEDCYRDCINQKRLKGKIQMTDQELEERTGKVKFYG